MTKLTEFVTVEGARLRLRPISLVAQMSLKTRLEQEYRERGLPLDPPTYEVRTATGEVERYPHDENTLQTDEDRAAWQRYQEAQAQFTAEFALRWLRMCLYAGIDLADPPPDWFRTWEALGIRFSDDPIERKIEYIQLEYLKTPQDVQECAKQIMLLSVQGDPVRQRALEEFFRYQVSGNAVERDSVGGVGVGI